MLIVALTMVGCNEGNNPDEPNNEGEGTVVSDIISTNKVTNDFWYGV